MCATYGFVKEGCCRSKRSFLRRLAPVSLIAYSMLFVLLLIGRATDLDPPPCSHWPASAGPGASPTQAGRPSQTALVHDVLTGRCEADY
jgi:hypothetical protein